jgi:hypothetical protein
MTSRRTLAGREAWLAIQQQWRKESQLAREATAAGSKRLTAYWTRRGCGRCVRELFTRYDVAALEEHEAALRRWRDPKSRRRDRFYCQAHTAPGDAGVGRYWRADVTIAGHTGWAFRMDDWNWRYYQKRVDQGPFQIGSFGKGRDAASDYQEFLVRNPVTMFADLEYDAYKFLAVEDGNYEAAVIACMQVRESRYLVLTANCVDATVRVLTAYGVRDLPSPQLRPAPAAWFDALAGGAVALR